MQKLSIFSLMSVALLALMAFVLRPARTYYTLEEFGGQAWYLPADGRLQEGIQYPLLEFTPGSLEPQMLKGLTLEGKHFTKITAKSSGDFFPADIVGKSFCGLFAHQNPASPNYDRVDEFYPQEVGSRYAKVVHRIDGKNVIVDFEYNGGNEKSPQKITDGKGYFFFDNSHAWDKLRQAATAKTNQTEEIRLQGFAISKNVQALYVIPQYQMWKCTPTNIKIWSSTKNIPALKMGYEDYYKLENRLGATVIQQDAELFNLPGQGTDHNLIVNIKLYPPHRTVLESSTFMRTVFTGRKAAGVTALVGAKQLDEERFVKAGKGLTNETFITWNFSSISAGGRLSSEKDGIMQEVEAFGYVLCKDYEQRGPFFTQMNGHAGNYLVVEDAWLDFENQNAINPTADLLRMRVNSGPDAYKGLPEEIVKRKQYYLPYVFQVDGPGNLFKAVAMGGGNRTNLLSFKGSKSVYTFIASVQGVRSGVSADFFGYWDMMFIPPAERSDWGMGKKGQEWFSRTSSKIMVWEQIPEKGKRYTISRHYEIKEGEKKVLDFNDAPLIQIDKKTQGASRKPPKGSVYSNVVRTAVAWTTVLGKYGKDIVPGKDVPANGKPLALQAGDKFKISEYAGSTHNPSTVYTVARKDRGPWPSFAAENITARSRKETEKNMNNPLGYRYFWCELDQDLPASIGLTFEIEMVESGCEELLDGKPREVWHTYKGIARLSQNGTGQPNSKNARGLGGYGVETPFNSPLFSQGEPLGHLCYTQVEITEWYKNVNWNNGFYRQNTNGGVGFKEFPINGSQAKSHPLARYSAGKTFINCSNGPLGQYTDKLNDFQMRDRIHTANGKPLPENQKAKLRLYNSPNVRTKGLKEPDQYLETYSTDKGAPEMPKECKEVLNRLLL